MIWRTGEFSPFLYRGGFVVLSLATVMVLMPLAHPACRLGPIARLQAAALDRRALLRRSTSGRRRSSSSPPPAGPATAPSLLRDAAAGGGDLRRLGALLEVRRGADPPRRASAASSPGAAGAAGAGTTFTPRGLRSSPSSPRGRCSSSPVAGMAGVNSATAEGARPGSRKPSPPATNGPVAADPGPGRRLDRHPPAKPSSTSATRPRRGSTRPNTCRPRKPADRSPYSEVGRQRNAHGDPGRALDRRALRRRTERPGSRRSLEGRRLQRAAGCWRWAPTRRPTSPPAPPSASANGSKR